MRARESDGQARRERKGEINSVLAGVPFSPPPIALRTSRFTLSLPLERVLHVSVLSTYWFIANIDLSGTTFPGDLRLRLM